MSAEEGTTGSGRWAALVLAAGEGKRLRQGREGGVPKVLREVGGRPMLDWVIGSAREAGAAKVVVVVGHRRESVIAALPAGVDWVVQEEPRGTGDAVRSAEDALGGWQGDVWILSGDVPGIGMVIVDGEIQVERSRNTPPPQYMPQVVKRGTG